MSISRRFSADSIAGKVDTYADLPAASEHSGQVWLCRESSGVLWANRKGLYLSDGTTWSRLSNATFKTEYIDSSLQPAPGHERGRLSMALKRRRTPYTMTRALSVFRLVASYGYGSIMIPEDYLPMERSSTQPVSVEESQW